MLVLLLALLNPVCASEAAFTGQLGAARQAFMTQKAVTQFSWQERDALLAMLRDPDPAVRIEALKALREYVGQSPYVWQTVLGVLNNRMEEPAVRYQSAKTLSRVAGYPEVWTTLARYATDMQTPPAFRGICYKSLWAAAAGNPQVRAGLLRGLTAAEPSVEGMTGAIWALGQASNHPDVAQALMRVAAHHPGMAIRVEAMKSLYQGTGRPEVLQAMAQTAGDLQTDPALRYPAILALSRVKTPQTQALLQNISMRDPNPALRQAAIMAMNPGDERIQAYFHMPRYTMDGRLVDPLENE
ncbi:MAG: HEAT repeat domain-containing protein [Elusimicrobiota bacterium]